MLTLPAAAESCGLKAPNGSRRIAEAICNQSRFRKEDLRANPIR